MYAIAHSLTGGPAEFLHHPETGKPVVTAERDLAQATAWLLLRGGFGVCVGVVDAPRGEVHELDEQTAFEVVATYIEAAAIVRQHNAAVTN
jgi:hypothetical protein